MVHSSTWSTGRSSGRRSYPGSTLGTSLTPHSLRNFTGRIQRDRPLDLVEDPGVTCLFASGAARRGRALLQRRLPYRLLRTTRGICLPNISLSLLNSNSHHASYLGLIARHTCTSFTHTLKSHSHTPLLCEVLICPGCHF